MKQKKIKAWAIIPINGKYVDLQPTDYYFQFPSKVRATRYLKKANWQKIAKIVPCEIKLLKS